MLLSITFNGYLVGALIIFALSLLRFILKFSNGSFFIESIYLYTTLTCLLMPYFGYTLFVRDNSIARLWVKYMPVPEEQYYGFMIPAIIMMSIAFFMFRQNSPD